MAGKPPRRPEYPDGSTLTYPPDIQALSNEAFEAEVKRTPDAQDKQERFLAALRNHQNKGIASGIYAKSSIRQPLKAMGGRKTRRNKTSGGDIVCHLLTIRNQIKLYHWQTKQFARHKATDDLTAALDLNIDAFVESYMGRYGRPTVSGGIKLHNFSEAAAKSFVAKETKYLETLKLRKEDTELLNLRDTILGDLTKVSYLFTLQ